MAENVIGRIVQHESGIWRVVGVTEAVGGAMLAELDCLDKGAGAQVPVAELQEIQVSSAVVERKIQERDARKAAGARGRQANLVRKLIAKARAAKASPERIAYLEEELAKYEGGES